MNAFFKKLGQEVLFAVVCCILFAVIFLLGAWIGHQGRDSELKRLRDEGAKITADLSAARASEQQATERLGKLQEQYSGLESDYLNLGKRYKDLESRVDAIQSGIGDVKSEVAAVEQGINDSQSLAAESGRLIKQLRDSL
jgi:chromosome segregation ATPase